MVEIEGEAMTDLRRGFFAPTMYVDGIVADMTMSVVTVENLTVQQTEARPLPALPIVVKGLPPVEIVLLHRIHRDTHRI